MKVSAIGKKNELCSGCHECEKTCAKIYFKTEELERAKLRVIKDDPSNKIITCTQCGVCITVCPTQAITRLKNGIVNIDKNKCIGCLSCIGFCPEEAMFQYKDETLPFKCISCGQCVKKCPTGAIFMVKNDVSVINQ
ncbi:MAG TPA: 4Fe-4S binding protein [Candidatus Wallbacteria bacterium]|nr:4Fe-4S binding protein [Candidatus Wallbacteria bacterium]